MTVVASYSQTAPGEAALERALEEARLRGDELRVVWSVVSSPSTHPSRLREWEQRRAETQSAAEELQAGLVGRGINVRVEVVTATTQAAGVLQVAESPSVQLLVIGLRRRSPVGKLVLGSVSQDILLHADCPVLAVKSSHE